MEYFLFDSEADAAAADARIISNVRAWVSANAPDALTADGSKLRSRNAATNVLEDVYTERWAVPQQRLDGKWVIPVPTLGDSAPVPITDFLSGVSAEKVEYDPSWFAQPSLD